MCIPVALLAGLNLRVLISITINHAHTRTHETAKSSKKKTTERCYRCLTKKRPFFIIEEHNRRTTPATPSSMLEESLNRLVENGRFHFSSSHRQLRTSNIELGVTGVLHSI